MRGRSEKRSDDMTEREANRTTEGEPPPVTFIGEWAQKSPTICEAKDGTQSGGRTRTSEDTRF